jgi:hypothetical protein
MEALFVPLRPSSLAEWAETDMAWWNELAAAKAAWMEGKAAANETRAAIAQATAHLRRKRE